MYHQTKGMINGQKKIINCSPWRGPFCFHKRGEDTKNEIFLRMSVCSTSAPDWHLQSGCITSIARPFAVRIPPHYATVTHGWVTHPGLARDARITAFTLSSVMTRGTWLPRRTYPAVPRGPHWTWWDKYTEKPHTAEPGDSKHLTNIAEATEEMTTLLTWRPWWPVFPNRCSTRVSLLTLQTGFSCRNVHLCDISL